MSAPCIAVIGAGITGLAAAHRLQELARERRLDLSVVVLESGPAIGGRIVSERVDGQLLEGGPDTLVLSKPAGVSLCERVGLSDDLVPLDPERSRICVLHRGRLRRVPTGFVMMAPTRLRPFVSSPLFSIRGKIRIALERFIPPRPPLEGDESLASFVTRRFGREALERVAEPVLAGLFTADADRLSLRASMPRLLEMEAREGSVTRGLARARGASATARAGIGYLRGGTGTLVDALRERLSDACIRTGCQVESIARESGSKRWSILGPNGSDPTRADAVIVACPAHAAAIQLERVDTALASELDTLRHVSCATVNLLYRHEDLQSAPIGHGFFVPRTEGRSFLACSFVSSRFPDRVPSDRVLLRVFLGGALHPDILERDDDALVQLAHAEVRELLRIARTPVVARAHRFSLAMPQPEVGFWRVRETIETRLGLHRGLFLAGSAIGEVGVPDCVASGERAALAAIEHALANRSGRAQPPASSAACSASQSSNASGV